MKSVKVQYMVKTEYAETNKKNIARVMADLRELAHPGIKYSTFVLDDGKTFVHFGMYADQEALDVVNNLVFRQEVIYKNLSWLVSYQGNRGL